MSTGWKNWSENSHHVKEPWPTWMCGHCSTANWQNYGKQAKQCRNCGLKKSFVQSTGNHEQNDVGDVSAPNSSVAAKLDAVAATLRNATSETPLVPNARSDDPAASTESATSEERPKILQHIKALQTALDALPDDAKFCKEREILAARIKEHKKKLIDSKPIGARIDGCKAVLARAVARRQSALKGTELAQAALKQADDEVATYTTELAALEAEVARVNAASTPGANDGNSLESLAKALQKVLEEMGSSNRVPVHLINETQASMKVLFDGVTKIAATTLVPPPPRGQTRPRTESLTPSPSRMTIDSEEVKVEKPGVRRAVIGKTKPKDEPIIIDASQQPVPHEVAKKVPE